MFVSIVDGDIYCKACTQYKKDLVWAGESDAIEHCANGEFCSAKIDLGVTKLLGAESRFVGSICTEVLTNDGMKHMKNIMRVKTKTPYQERLHSVYGLYFWGLEEGF